MTIVNIQFKYGHLKVSQYAGNTIGNNNQGRAVKATFLANF